MLSGALDSRGFASSVASIYIRVYLSASHGCLGATFCTYKSCALGLMYALGLSKDCLSQKKTWSNQRKMRFCVMASISGISCFGLHVRRIKKGLEALIWLMLLSVAALHGIFSIYGCNA